MMGSANRSMHVNGGGACSGGLNGAGGCHRFGEVLPERGDLLGVGVDRFADAI